MKKYLIGLILCIFLLSGCRNNYIKEEGKIIFLDLGTHTYHLIIETENKERFDVWTDYIENLDYAIEGDTVSVVYSPRGRVIRCNRIEQ